MLRVSFQEDDTPATTGDGSFVLEDTVDIECNDWSLDPPPHDRTYFSDHLLAANNYWQKVSDGAVSIDLDNSAVFPLSESLVYQLPHDMLYYHPYLEDFDETEKLFEFSRDVIELADPDVDFSSFTTIIIVHAGMGGDFAFALDPTPGNIPSAYLSQTDFSTYGTLQTDEGDLQDLIIVPESQNFLQYKETRGLFEDAEDPCFYQVGLNGTLALMFGFHLGLPPLFNTETGRALVGGFALMDQGSNNFHGVVPAYPDPYTRIEMGWATPNLKEVGDSVSITVDDPPVRINISDTEYYLIENRQRNLLEPAGMTVWIDGPGFDTVSVILSDGGVVLDVDEQHAGVPGNGLNIWHIDESAWFTNENPNGGPIQLVDFLEADGAQDMGHTTQLLFADYLETGWWFDTWFAGNEGWFHLNRFEEIIGDSLLNLSSFSSPSTLSNTGTPSHLRIENISKNGRTMSFSISSDRMVVTDSISAFIGFSTQSNSLWALNSDSSQILASTFEDGALLTSPHLIVSPGDFLDSTFDFRSPWILPHRARGVRFLNIETGESHYNSTVRNPYEVAIGYGGITPFTYFATKTNASNVDVPVIVKLYTSMETSTSEELLDWPSGKFQTSSGIQIFYGNTENNPRPVGVLAPRDPNTALTMVPDEVDVLTWSSAENGIKISNLPDETFDIINTDKPEIMIPVDVDLDGYYEIVLFYANRIHIINQSGVAWAGSPFSVEAYYGNPIIAPMLDGETAIFLRHERSYSLHSLDGKVLDKGMLPLAEVDIQNQLRQSEGLSLLLTGNELLYFEHELNTASGNSWYDPQGNTRGDRVVTPPTLTTDLTPSLKHGSVYNYPNPIKGQSTTIRAWIGEEDTWSIEIFSLSGAQVLFIEQEVMQKNAHNEWVWDASSVSNGVYLAQVVAGDKSEIIKIAVIR